MKTAPDIEKLQAENTHLKKTIEDLWTINQLARLISSTMPVNDILDKVVSVSIKAIKAEQGTISLLDEKEKEEDIDQFKTLIRKVNVTTAGGKYRLDEHLSGWMLKNRKPLMINDVKKDETLKGVDLLNQDIGSLLSVPLVFKGKLTGVVNVFNKKEGGIFSNDDQRLLSIIAAQSAQVIENARLYAEEKRLRKYQQELEMARDIQEGLIPKETPETDVLDIASYFSPADQVGGDYFDYFQLTENELGVVMADVSGHGASAALVMTMMKGIVHALTNEFESPERIVSELNTILDQIGPKEKFVTLAFLLFDLEKKKLLFSNAGHPPLVFYRSVSKACELIELKGPALGLSKLSQYQEQEISLKSGDLILIYTDGITEAFNDKGEMFEEGRLLESVKTAASGNANEVIDHIKSDIQNFVQKAPQSDDVAMIAIKVN